MSLKKIGIKKNTSLDLQIKERCFQTQFSISTDELDKLNINKLFEQEILNKMNIVSMVANVYVTIMSFILRLLIC